MALPRDESGREKNGGGTDMTDQEIINAMRNKHCEEVCPMAGKCYEGYAAEECEVCNAVLAACDRLEELTENRSSVMMPKEDV